MIKRRLPVYDIDTHFFTSREEAREFVQKHDPKQVGALDDCRGIVLELTPAKGPRLRCMCVFEPDRNIVIHEAVHMAWLSLNHCNVKVTFRNDEPLAYLVAHFAEEMFSILKEGQHE